MTLLIFSLLIIFEQKNVSIYLLHYEKQKLQFSYKNSEWIRNYILLFTIYFEWKMHFLAVEIENIKTPFIFILI